MKTKVCKKCGIEKSVNEFYKRDNKLYNKCKKCISEEKLKYKRTIKGLIVHIYRDQKKSSKERCHPLPIYTFEELYEWILSQPHFEELYNNWVKSGYKTDLRPSIDRLDDNKGYSFDNIRLVTWKENALKGAMSKVKKVIQYDLEGNLIKIWDSISEASRETKIYESDIRAACIGKKIKRAGNYQWRFFIKNFLKKISSYQKNMYTVKIAQYDLEGNLIKIWDSMTDAAKYTNITKSNIWGACKNYNNRKTAGGYIWKYI